jgi:hypothetical protein
VYRGGHAQEERAGAEHAAAVTTGAEKLATGAEKLARIQQECDEAFRKLYTFLTRGPEVTTPDHETCVLCRARP